MEEDTTESDHGITPPGPEEPGGTSTSTYTEDALARMTQRQLDDVQQELQQRVQRARIRAYQVQIEREEHSAGMRRRTKSWLLFSIALNIGVKPSTEVHRASRI